MSQLPNSLEEAIAQSREATKAALADGYTRLQVELIFPELKPMPIAEEFLPLFAEYESHLKVLFADAGSAALARREWVDVPFQIFDIGTGRAASIQTKIQPEDKIAFFVSPTSVELPQLEKICEVLGERPFVMLNPRLEDSATIGIGYAGRQARDRFINTIESCYYLRPVDDDTAVLRCYPGQWEIWVQQAGNWEKFVELPKKPSGDDIDYILAQGQSQTSGNAAPVKKPNVFKSLQRFIKALSS
ncbi:DUF1995 family protein [Nostoc sp. FACHB-110]|uniref:DUF1995 family protein n=1 Tax=Nostoc sp. FACHB-110 TaxID=2692834 RepID=UPI00168576F4|nr:DUF1995 family protein [Nostoc sp. FACHB-110]MBD2439313.1 DUF1995 family protein [Nostoc sp. FACHB-110]